MKKLIVLSAFVLLIWSACTQTPQLKGPVALSTAAFDTVLNGDSVTLYTPDQRQRHDGAADQLRCPHRSPVGTRRCGRVQGCRFGLRIDHGIPLVDRPFLRADRRTLRKPHQ